MIAALENMQEESVAVPAGDQSRKTTLHQAMHLMNTIVEDFECSICLEHLTNTHISPECLHRFCGDCIKESLRKCNNQCPSCRVHIPTKRTLRKDKQFDNIVSDIFLYVRTY